MSFNGLNLEYALEGNLNYIAWNDRMEEVLEEKFLNDFIDTDVPQPTTVYSQLLDAWKKNVAKERRILL